MQGFPNLTLLIFWTGSFFIVKGYPVHGQVCIGGVYALDTSSITIHFGVTTKIISRRHQMFSGLRSDALIWKVDFPEPAAKSFWHHSPPARLPRRTCSPEWSLFHNEYYTKPAPTAHFAPVTSGFSFSYATLANDWNIPDCERLIVSILLLFVREDFVLLSQQVNASLSISNLLTLQRQWL